MDTADTCEQKAREAKQRAIKAQEEVAELEKKAQQLESELDKAKEDLLTTTEKLKEKESTLACAELGNISTTNNFSLVLFCRSQFSKPKSYQP